MSWFRSRYVRLLEAQIARHAEETEALKKTHAEELNRCIVEANRGWAEADRLRQYLIPGLPASTRNEVPEKESPPAQNVETGTPWQRIQAKYAKMQEEQERLAEIARKSQVFPTPKEAPASPASKEN